MEKKDKIVFTTLFFIVFLLTLLIINVFSHIIKDNTKEINITNISDEIKDKKIYANIEIHEKEDTICIYNKEVIRVENNICQVEIPNEVTTITVKTNKAAKPVELNPNQNQVLDFELSKDELYIIKGETKTIEAKKEVVGNPKETLTLEAKDNIVSIDNNSITGIENGETIIYASIGNVKKEIKVYVTDLITMPTLNNNKKYLPCGIYSKEDNDLIDNYLLSDIEDAGGKGTRGAVVAAARFLTLKFPYKIKYFYENGRLNNNTGGAYVDGEGRYYHDGLYLNSSRYSTLVKSWFGPSTWGCPLYNWEDAPYQGFVRGTKVPNGLDCSGLVTWVLKNGGYDPKDTGAGDNSFTDDDLGDLGTHIPLTMERLQSGEIKAGDIIATDGHTALVGGIHDGHIYVVESTTYYYGVVMHDYTFKEVLDCPYLTYYINMDEYYQNEGVYSNYWN